MPATTINPLPSICRRYNRLLDALDREARAHACKGDIVVGWDWPTLRIVKPKEYAELRALQKQHQEESSLLRGAGLHPSQTGTRHAKELAA